MQNHYELEWTAFKAELEARSLIPQRFVALEDRWDIFALFGSLTLLCRLDATNHASERTDYTATFGSIENTEIRGYGASTAAVTSVSASASSVELLAANPYRLSFKLFNDSAAYAYVKFGATASSTSFTLKMSPNSFWEPEDAYPYRGVIEALWSSATGSMRITEMES